MVRALVDRPFARIVVAKHGAGHAGRCVAALDPTSARLQSWSRGGKSSSPNRFADFNHYSNMHGNRDQATIELDDALLAFRAAATMAEREQAFRLVYDAYLQSGLAIANQAQMRILPHHLLSTSEMFVAVDGDRVASTVTLVRDGELGLPMEEIYPDQIDAQRMLGKHLGEVSCLASISNLSLKVCLELFRVMVQAARQRGVDALLVAIHPKHERFYRRYLAFESLGGRTGYPSVCNNPAVALLLDFNRIDIERPANWQRFFGQPLPSQVLRASPMSVAEKRHLARLLLQTGAPALSASELDPRLPATASEAGRAPQPSLEFEAASPLQFEPIAIG